MATSLSITACLNLSQARPSLLRRVIRSLLRGLVEGLDGVALEGLDMFTLEVFRHGRLFGNSRRDERASLNYH